MTDTQWLLDLVEEATNRVARLIGALARLPSDQGQADALKDLRDLERDYGNVARLCVEQHEALTEIFNILGPRTAQPCTCDGCDCENGLAAEVVQRALARFVELKP